MPKFLKDARPPKTPLQKQRDDLKQQHPDKILLFRIGDFYEAFDEDAEVCSKVLGLTVTRRGTQSMAGFPHHALEQYLHKLLTAGKRVAICDPVEDATKVRHTDTRVEEARVPDAPAAPPPSSLWEKRTLKLKAVSGKVISVEAEVLEPFGVHRAAQSNRVLDGYNLTHLPTGLAVLVEWPEPAALHEAGECLILEHGAAFLEESMKAVNAALPQWARAWLIACNRAKKLLDTAPYRDDEK